MTKPKLTYPIRAVSRMTGVAIDTLRAWERRYQAVVPARGERGRVYDEADVARIRLLRDAVAAGHSIGQAVRMNRGNLEAAAAAARRPLRQTDARRPEAIDVEAVLAALERYDASEVERELSRAAALLPAPELLRSVIVPVLTGVGDRWHDQQGGIAQEHMLSAIVRNVLGSLMRLYARNTGTGRLLFATPSGERHEFGTMGAALFAAVGGLPSIYFGADLPASEIAAVANMIDVDIVVLGLSGAADVAQIDRELEQLAAALKSDVEIWLGGPGAPDAAGTLNGRVLVVESYDALEPQLVRAGGRF
ncbi:MAG: MerR family transcriptional regulator [Vicinamibacterales bacterium]